MPHTPCAPRALNAIGFLQTFIVQSIKVGGQIGCLGTQERTRYIEHLGLAAASCLESACRSKYALAPDAHLDRDQYADLIVAVKNQIGGSFTRASSPPGIVRVVNRRCPFGDSVREAPELCRMTSSVFGAIAARNFGYAKVELRKRIATGDGMCEVCVHTDPVHAEREAGDEYRFEDGRVSSRLAGSGSVQVQQTLSRAWCTQHGSEPPAHEPPTRIVAESSAMKTALEAARIVAPTTTSVLITGETGVGKEIIARTVHTLSERSTQPFVAINCGAIPDGLVESELFGHERGAFTGAYQVHHGYFERADRGTLFLDEVNSLPAAAQVRLLRVLQEGEFERVGGARALRVDVRVLAASNRNMEELIAEGGFRHDLYYRLNVVPVHLPALRERPDDLSALVTYLLGKLAQKYRRADKMLSPKAWRQMMAYDWPGNVRELENLLERAFLFTPGEVIDTVVAGADTERGTECTSLRELKRKAAAAAESQAIHDSLRRYGGRVRAVASELGVTPRAIHQKVKEHGIEVAKYRP